MTWIDVQHDPVIMDEYLKMIKIFMGNWKAMENWKVELTVQGQDLSEIKILRGIFQEDSLSLPLIVIAMIPLNYFLRKCKGEYKSTCRK